MRTSRGLAVGEERHAWREAAAKPKSREEMKELIKQRLHAPGQQEERRDNDGIWADRVAEGRDGEGAEGDIGGEVEHAARADCG